MITQTAASLTPTADTRYSVIDAYTQASRAAARAGRVKAACEAEARRVRFVLAKELARTLRQTRGAGFRDDLIVVQMSGVHQDKFWPALEAATGEKVPKTAEARGKIISWAKDIAAGREVSL